MKPFVDYHCHLLPALDDGATDPEEALAMAAILSSFGFREVCCTPHRIKGCFENTPDRVRQATASLQRLLEQAGIPLLLTPGTEHYLDEFLIDQVDGALRAASRYLLVEVPFRSEGEMVPALVTGLKNRGLTPLFAHPERCRAFEPALRSAGLRGALSSMVGRPKLPEMEPDAGILKLRSSGCRFQGNLGSFAGWYGSEAKQRALLFLKNGVYSCLGSDAHRSDDLEVMLRSGYQAIAAEIGAEAADRLMAGSEL